MAHVSWPASIGVGCLGWKPCADHTPLAIHAHRNGFGAMSRHPLLGMAFPAYHTLYRLAGIDHMHVHGIGGKFVDTADEVTEAARACLQPLSPDGPDDRVTPAFSSGQWAGTLAASSGSRTGSRLHVHVWRRHSCPSKWPGCRNSHRLHEAYRGADGRPKQSAEGAKTKTELAAAIDFFGAH